MIGYIPTKLELKIEKSQDGQTTLVFREWHERVSDKDFKLISQQTKISAALLFEKYKHLGYDVKYSVDEAEKSFKVTYTGEKLRPAITAIFGELMPLIVNNEKEAVQTMKVCMQLIDFCLDLKIVKP